MINLIMSNYISNERASRALRKYYLQLYMLITSGDMTILVTVRSQKLAPTVDWLYFNASTLRKLKPGVG